METLGSWVGAASSTHSVANNVVIAERWYHGEDTFSGRGDVDVLVIVIHRKMRPCGHSYPRDRPRSVGQRPSAYHGGPPSLARGSRAADDAVVADAS
jgi:hypothetical protein